MGRRFFLLFILLLSYFFFIPHTLGEVEANHCTAPRPGGAPVLTSAVPHERSVTLTWTEAQDPVTYFLVAYGTSPNGIEYGAPNIGGRESTSFTVSELTNGVKYYFRVRGVNDCKPGKFSNKLSAVPGTPAGTVLGTNKTLSKTPNLSIYKQVLGASASGVPKPTVEGKTPVREVALTKGAECPTCIDWQLLAGGVILLILFFYLANRFPFLKQIYSLVIPVAMYILFLKINGQCLTNEFFCKYFLELDIIIFILAVIIRKNRYLQHKIYSLELLSQRKVHK